MLNIGWSEALIIAIVAIVVFPPRDLPRMMRTVGQFAARLRRTASEFRYQFEQAAREIEIDEIRRSLQTMHALPQAAEERPQSGSGTRGPTASRPRKGPASQAGKSQKKKSRGTK
jgi:sec-independent protein translocase protein TatB